MSDTERAALFMSEDARDRILLDIEALWRAAMHAQADAGLASSRGNTLYWLAQNLEQAFNELRAETTTHETAGE